MKLALVLCAATVAPLIGGLAVKLIANTAYTVVHAGAATK